MLTPCEKPMASKMETNEDLAVFTSQVLAAWETCAAKMNALIEFYLEQNDKIK